MTTKRRTIALLMDSVRIEYQAEVRFGVERAAEAHDVNLLIAFGEMLALPGSGRTAQNSIYQLVGEETVDGVIIVSSTLCHHVGIEQTRRFCQGYAPLPVCSIGMEIDGIPSLLVDNTFGSDLSVGHLVDAHGRRRIAYLGGPAENTEAREREGAYRRALAERSVPCDERLVALGAFTIESGRTAMHEILSRGVAFDAVVAANDNMAHGALEALAAHGLSVPKDVAVCGFDDVAIARFTQPSLTTVRQPIKQLGALAVDTVVRTMRGEAVPARRMLPVELTVRESCGCRDQPVAASAPPSQPASVGRPSLAGHREALEGALKEALSIPTGSLGGWPAALLSALEDELSGQEGRFVSALGELLEEAEREGANIEQLQGVITLLRERLGRPRERGGAGPLGEAIEQLWHLSRVLVGGASVRAEGERRLGVELASLALSWSGRSFSTCLSLPALKDTLASVLPMLGLTRAAVSLYDDPRRDTMRPLFVMESGRAVDAPAAGFPARCLAPAGFLETAERWSMFAIPIAFGDLEKFGVAVLNSGANEMVYDALRLQLGSAVKAAALHREVVRQVELRERLEQENVRRETRVATHIQTTLVPARLHIEGLELSAVMKPAAEVGGDYYDVLATEGGGWLGIGDVAGHGLAAGVIMLMIQSMVAALTRRDPTASPSEIVTALNAAVYDSVRNRLRRDEHATLLLLRYERSGRVTFAGAHDDIIVCRARTRRCVCIASTGAWVGAMPAIDGLTRDSELVLEDGDLLVLYSDGVTKARNPHQKAFGLERLCSAIEAAQAAPAEAIRDHLLREIERWCPCPDDDITIVVARHRAPGAARPT